MKANPGSGPSPNAEPPDEPKEAEEELKRRVPEEVKVTVMKVLGIESYQVHIVLVPCTVLGDGTAERSAREAGWPSD
ncbi:uncharacterized protein G2W53_000002 [Senna tora]|uniref:Uncharacterized protein n=1 Tax=Senna tora TaxID=362788 RepID=A0A834XF15_9FABA|nr:uncharacterized protein G2W53_000002 [Senna tora]